VIGEPPSVPLVKTGKGTSALEPSARIPAGDRHPNSSSRLERNGMIRSLPCIVFADDR
jgi:hypothetical protein